MAQYIANEARHLRAGCARAISGGARPLRIDQDREWLEAARRVLPRCGICWRAHEERRGAAATQAELLDLEIMRANATDEHRRLVAALLARTLPGSRSSPPVGREPSGAEQGLVVEHEERPEVGEPAAGSGPARSSARELLLEIARCQNVVRCIEGAGMHPCSQVVAVQAASHMCFELPEPWSGRLDSAPILFVSSNPSIPEKTPTAGVSGIDEGIGYPRWRWSDEDVAEYFELRFGGGRREWVKDGVRNLGDDGRHGRAVRFWVEVKRRAEEMLGRRAVPGVDYAMTEVVHCKSRGERGVREAAEECAERYLRRVLSVSRARVIVVLGAIAREAVAREFRLRRGEAVSTIGPIGGLERLVVFLPHPNARMVRSLAECVAEEDLARLRAALG